MASVHTAASGGVWEAHHACGDLEETSHGDHGLMSKGISRLAVAALLKRAEEVGLNDCHIEAPALKIRHGEHPEETMVEFFLRHLADGE